MARLKAGLTIPLGDAVEVAGNYILAYSDPEALQVDSEYCTSIGGRIHVAMITPRGGFEWVPGLETLPSQ